MAGLVTKISLRSTTVVTNDNISIIVPNSDFITHQGHQLELRRSQGADPDAGRGRLRHGPGAAAGSCCWRWPANIRRCCGSPAPEVFFSGFGDSSLNFELGVWTAEMTSKPRRFRSELNFAIERKLRENHIEIPFPQRDVHLRSGHFVFQPPALAQNKGGAEAG